MTDLSEVEFIVLAMRAEGCSVKEIADRRQVSVHTVQKQMFSIVKKFGARNSVHAIALAFREGILWKDLDCGSN